MRAKLISLPCVQLARLFCLVRNIEPAQLEESQDWVLLIRGRGFDRLLEEEMVDTPNLIRPVGWSSPRPIIFCSQEAAVVYALHIGLLPAKKTWHLVQPKP